MLHRVLKAPISFLLKVIKFFLKIFRVGLDSQKIFVNKCENYIEYLICTSQNHISREFLFIYLYLIFN